MYRRDFLKMSGLVSAALFMQINSMGKMTSNPMEVESHGMLYRGIADGKVIFSADQGETWQLHTNFGSEFSIMNLGKDFWGQVCTRLGFAGNSFELVLEKNSKIWRTI